MVCEASAGGGGFEAHVAALVAQEAAGDGEAEAAAGVSGREGIVGAEEALEDFLAEGMGDAGAAVPDAEDAAGERNGERAASGGVFCGVVDEVEEGLFEGVAVHENGTRRGKIEGEGDAGLIEAGDLGAEDGGGGFGGVEGGWGVIFAALLHAAEIEDVVDEAGEALGFADDGFEIGGAFRIVADATFEEHFRIHADGGEGGFEFVGDVGDERRLAEGVAGVAPGLAPEEDAGGEGEEDEGGEGDGGPWWVRAWRSGFVVLPRSVGGALVLGALVSAAVMTLVPENYVAERISHPLAQMGLTLAFGIPVYICSTAAVPFALGLLAAGLTPGAAMAFLVGGPGVSASTLIAVWRMMGARSAAVYAGVLAVCAIGFGWLVDGLLPAGWAPPGLRTAVEHAHCEEGMDWTVHAGAIALLATVGWAKWGPRGKRAASPGASCGSG